MTPLVSSSFSLNSISVISCRSVLLFAETGVLGEDHRPVLIGINCVLYEFCVYAGDACITVDLHESDKRNALLGPLLIDN
jgi:hypothetical protein